ncbi:hypothetical protein ACQI4L_25285 [Mycolicibacterium litorale]|uniref:DUF7937 domain-containing protein n=1 Tax=Mycolicibacterium litorale TaxID=758802 RepID=UPI003CF1CB89
MTIASPRQTATSVVGDLLRTNRIRDGVAALLVLLGVLLPWNIGFGATITGSAGWAMAVVVTAAVASSAGLAISHVGRFSIRRPDADLRILDRLRLAANVPALAAVAGFTVFALVEAIRTGGSATVPPGVGPGAWLALAGALLAAAPVITAPDARQGCRAGRIIGIASLVLAVAAALFTLYWRTRFVAPHIADPDTGAQNLSVLVAAVAYGVVALLPVVLAARWSMSADPSARMSVVLLGDSTLVAGTLVWLLPAGRDLDAFHGIAQTTSTAGVGFEGYVAWVAVAALVGSGTVLSARGTLKPWRSAARKCLLLIAVWCGGTAILRIVDLVMSALLALPDPPYNATTLMAFDLVTAVVAGWLYVNSAGNRAPRLLLGLLTGTLFVLTVCRVVVGVALVPRVAPLNPDDITDVYGNTLAQQITGTFDVVMCAVALALTVIALRAGPAAAGVAAKTPAAKAHPEFEVRQYEMAAGRPVETAVLPLGAAAPTIAIPSATPATVRIARPSVTPSAAPADRVADVLAQSTQRFAAGTTYGAKPADVDSE